MVEFSASAGDVGGPMPGRGGPDAVAPHPPIDGYYAKPGEKRAFLTSIFDETAADYDKVEKWLSLGTGAWYRRQVLLKVGLKPGMQVADVAVGTGLVAREALRLMAVEGLTQGRVVGVDPSEGMLAQARAKLNIETVQAMAESLPFADSTFDLVTMGYALRHVEDLALAFGEFRRVLKPGGKVCVLEITRPQSKLGRTLLRGYLSAVGGIVGRMTKLAPRTPELWKYYWETIDQCVAPERVLEALRAAGFKDVKRSVMGVFSEYVGVAPE
jgi:demethylmenaquinone methyltransferase/2-methoxy-6-polyprenyl-1,4-benzoquinol methylase